MNIYLTLDYELFFGNTPGSAEKCMLEPTKKLIEIGERTGAKMTFFIDSGYLHMLEKFGQNHPELIDELDRISSQLVELVSKGHDCQLHVHPHWEDALYEKGQWIFEVRRYKLSDFSEAEVMDIFRRYSASLIKATGQKIESYRAGGWCIQPFAHVKKAFLETGIRLDSTVFPGGKNINEVYNYDYSSIQTSKTYRFEDDILLTDRNGSFYEFPIAAQHYHPLFFWQLYGWGRIIPSRHKPIGDGYPIATSGERTKRLTSTSRLPVSLDGYFAKRLSAAVRNHNHEELVIIGHPKACTLYSLNKLEKFIQKNSKDHTFITFSERLRSIDQSDSKK